MRKRDTALATYKTCPRCGGTGRVTCDGRDHIRQKYLAWAYHFHMTPVVYKAKNQPVPGVAVAGINPGGWAFLDIYVSKTDKKVHGLNTHFNEVVGAWIYVRRRKKRGTKVEYENFYAIECRGPDMDKVEPLEVWPQHLMLLPANYELDDGSLAELLLIESSV